jgi:glycosyltransferase involved in cell wall biosynthesis
MQDMQQKAQGIHCVALLNAIDTATLEPQLKNRTTARALLGLANETFVFANVGRLHADKDQTTLIRAFALIAHDYPAAQLLLIGQGKCEAQYRALINSLQLQNRITLTGPLPDAATFFRAFDVYVSASDKEPFGIVLAEAMLAHLPVISTHCGGAPEVLGEHAHYFSSGDSVALAAQMTTLLNTTAEQRQQQGELLYQRLHEHFSFPTFAHRLHHVIKSMSAGNAC